MTARPETAAADRRCGFVATVGAPNVGKSTLVNRLVGTKVSIVSPKAQTTRMRVLGIVVREQTQIVLIDTPGLFEPKFRLDTSMVGAAWRTMADADAVMLMVDSIKGIDRASREVMDWLTRHKRPAVAVLNKIDAVDKPTLLQQASDLGRAGVFEHIFMISALNGDGVDDVLLHLTRSAPKGPWMFAGDDISDLPPPVLAAEVTREKLYFQLQQELPYASAVRTESWRELAGGGVRIEQVIYVERPSHRAILIGRQGQRIKQIGEAARKELTQLLDRTVHLFLHVKVREKWRDSRESAEWHRLEE